MGLFSASNDILTVDIPIKMSNALDQASYSKPPEYPIEFFLTKKSRSKYAMETHEHFSSLVYPVKAANLPVPKPPANKKEAREQAKRDHLIVLGENEESVNQLIDKSAGEILQKYGDSLHELHVTDQKVYNQYSVFIRAKIEVGSTDESMTQALKVLTVVFSIIDKVVRLKLPDQVKAKAEKNRKKLPSAKDKEVDEQNEQEKVDKLRQEAEAERERLRKMTPEQRKKYEEKKKKREMESQKKKMTKFLKH